MAIHCPLLCLDLIFSWLPGKWSGIYSINRALFSIKPKAKNSFTFCPKPTAHVPWLCCNLIETCSTKGLEKKIPWLFFLLLCSFYYYTNFMKLSPCWNMSFWWNLNLFPGHGHSSLAPEQISSYPLRWELYITLTECCPMRAMDITAYKII